MKVRVHFGHGLGDCTHFAFQLPLYVRRGYDVTVVCNPDKGILFRHSGVTISHERQDEPAIGWHEGISFDSMNASTLWAANKSAHNLSVRPMPDIGKPAELWDEYCDIKLDLRPFIPKEDWNAVSQFLQNLPRPIVLLHTKGNSYQEGKSLPDSTALELYQQLLDVMPGTVVLLDWDNRVPRMASYRVRHLTDDWEWIQIPRLMALIHEADLLIGIDSGPLHATRFTQTPAIGLFPTAGHYPVRVCLPRSRQVNIVPRGYSHDWNKKARIAFNLVECPGDTLRASFVADMARRALAGSRYLSAEQLGADLQLQQFVLDWERGTGSALTPYVDRDHSFDQLLHEVSNRFVNPQIVETGCIRAGEDWRGAGFSTYLFGAFLERFGGQLSSFDIDAANCRFAVGETREMTCVSVECRDSVDALANFNRPIDVLLLDSCDTFVSGHAEHALNETKAAIPWLHSKSMILFDDTVYQARKFHGKGELAIPWLLENGWRILYSSYQTLLERTIE